MSYSEKQAQIDELRKQIEAYGALNDAVKKKIDYKFRLDWNYYSNSMEGNTLTMDETRSVMVGNITIGGKPIKDVLEVKGHDEVISNIIRIGKGEVRLSEARIKEIHKGIMHEDDPEARAQIGNWKKSPNYIINYRGERFDFTSPADVPTEMHDLLDRTNASIDAINAGKKNAPHPLDVALKFHLEYVVIHPFYDGNGRTARILTNLLLISFGYPPFWIKEAERKSYNQYLADIQGYGGNPDLFYDLIASTIVRSQQIVIDAIEGIDISEEDDIDKLIHSAKATLAGSKFKKLQKEIAEQFVWEIIAPAYEYLNQKTIHFDDQFIRIRQSIILKINHSPLPIPLRNQSDPNQGVAYIIQQLEKEGDLYHMETNFARSFMGFKHSEKETRISLNLSFKLNELNANIICAMTNITEIQIFYKETGKYDFKPVKQELDRMITEFIEEMMSKRGAD